jgi:osmotically-inducible protein OsmY
MGNVLGLVAGIGVGAGVMYLLDPSRGKRRRALARDEVAHVGRSAWRTGKGRLRDAFNRAIGVATVALARIQGEGMPDDDVLAERVRSRLGHIAGHPEGIDVAAHNGTVTLTGWAFAEEVEHVDKSVSSMRGVQRLESHLEERHSAVMAPGHRTAPSP